MLINKNTKPTSILNPSGDHAACRIPNNMSSAASAKAFLTDSLAAHWALCVSYAMRCACSLAVFFTSSLCALAKAAIFLRSNASAPRLAKKAARCRAIASFIPVSSPLSAFAAHTRAIRNGIGSGSSCVGIRFTASDSSIRRNESSIFSSGASDAMAAPV